MAKEFNALLHNQTWSLVHSSQASDIVTCKWVFRTKWFDNETIESQKAWLVAKSFFQQFGIDFDETF